MYLRVTTQTPCAICGKTDYCTYKVFDNGTIKHLCFRTHSGQDVINKGVSYTFIKQGSCTTGNYSTYINTNDYNSFLESLKQGSSKNRSAGNIDLHVRKEEQDTNCVSLLEPARLDQIYHFFLQQLVLEPRHRQILEKEWNCGIEKNLSQKILNHWQIKSLPPNDSIRFKSYLKYQNRTRKSIMESMLQKFSSLEGAPGFFKRDSDGMWTFSNLCGIVYPIYNSHNQIIALRVADDCPVVKKPLYTETGEIQRDQNKNKIYEGYYYFNFNAEWVYQCEDKAPKVVYSKDVQLVTLTEKGYPKGEVDGKYKNFSSYKRVLLSEDDHTIYYGNKFCCGSQSGSNISLYTKKGDDFTTVYITEGEKKAIVLNMLLHVPVISVPGVGTYSKIFKNEHGFMQSLMDRLEAYGCRNWIIAYDSDKKNNTMVLQAEHSAARSFLEKGSSHHIYIAEWNIHFGKGADDIFIQGNRPTLYRVT